MKKTIPPSAIAKTAAGVGAVAATVALGMLVKRQRVRATCKPFYSGATRCFKIPGLNEGFVPQDLFYLDDEKTWLFSGYEANRKPSPIFQVSEDEHVRRHEVLFPSGSLYRGHGAAITAAGPFVFLTVRDGFVAIDRATLADAADGDILQATGHRAIARVHERAEGHALHRRIPAPDLLPHPEKPLATLSFRRDQPSARVRLRAPRPRPLRIWGASGGGVFHPRKCAGAVRHARRQYRAQLGLGLRRIP